MRIITINKEKKEAIDIGFTERYVRKLAGHLAQYSISLMPRIETVDKKFFDLRILVIGAKEPDSAGSFNFIKLRITGPGEIKLKAKFLKSGANYPKPLIFIYKKSKKAAVSHALFEILESYFSQLVKIYKKKLIIHVITPKTSLV